MAWLRPSVPACLLLCKSSPRMKLPRETQGHPESPGPVRVEWSGCKVPRPPTGSRIPTRVGDVIPVGGVELIFGLEDLFEELGVIFIIKRRVATEPARQDGVRM